MFPFDAGSTIRDLEVRSGAKIKISSTEEDPRPFTLEGSSEIRHYAKSIIYDFLDSQNRTGIRPADFKAPLKPPTPTHTTNEVGQSPLR